MNNVTSKSSIEIIAPSSVVWEALVSPPIIKKYFFDSNAVSEWKVGGEILFKGIYKGRPYIDKGTILEMNPFKTFRYNYWSPLSGIEDKPENYIAITYSLAELKGITTIEITQENLGNTFVKTQIEKAWQNVLLKLKNVVEDDLVEAHFRHATSHL